MSTPLNYWSFKNTSRRPSDTSDQGSPRTAWAARLTELGEYLRTSRAASVAEYRPPRTVEHATAVACTWHLSYAERIDRLVRAVRRTLAKAYVPRANAAQRRRAAPRAQRRAATLPRSAAPSARGRCRHACRRAARATPCTKPCAASLARRCRSGGGYTHCAPTRPTRKSPATRWARRPRRRRRTGRTWTSRSPGRRAPRRAPTLRCARRRAGRAAVTHKFQRM